MELNIAEFRSRAQEWKCDSPAGGQPALPPLVYVGNAGRQGTERYSVPDFFLLVNTFETIYDWWEMPGRPVYSFGSSEKLKKKNNFAVDADVTLFFSGRTNILNYWCAPGQHARTPTSLSNSTFFFGRLVLVLQCARAPPSLNLLVVCRLLLLF